MDWTTPTRQITLDEYFSIHAKIMRGLIFDENHQFVHIIRESASELIDYLLPKMYDCAADYRVLQKYIQSYIDDCKGTGRQNIRSKAEYRKYPPVATVKMADKGITSEDLFLIFGANKRITK